MSSLPTIACKDCNHVNEGQRIYCHNCGNKLDRTQVLEKAQKEDSPEKKQKRVKKMMNPGAGFGLGWGTVKTAARTLVWAVVAAAVINIARPPAGVPPMPKDRLADAPQLDITLQELTLASPGREVALEEAEINLYLQNTVRSKNKKGESVIAFQRAFVNLDEGLIRITSQTAIQNYPLYAGVTHRLKMENGAFSATPEGLHFGRLRIPIPEFAATNAGPIVGALFKPLWESLKRETRMIHEIGTVEAKKGQIVLHSRDAQKSAGSPATLPATPPTTP